MLAAASRTVLRRPCSSTWHDLDGVPADIDVLVVGAPDVDELDEVAEKAQAKLRRPVNIRRIRPETWNASNPTDPFITSVNSRPLVTIVGTA
jgi:hypothetical protein